MTMGRTTVRWPAVLAFYFVCIGLLNPIFAEDKVKVTAKGAFGETAQVVCEVLGNETNFEWKFNQVPLKENDRINITITREKALDQDGGEKIIKTMSTVTISNVSSLDAGNYTCNVGSSGFSQAYLNLNFETTFINITKGPINVNLSQSLDVTIECIFEVYDDKAQVKWFKIGDPTNVESKTPVRFSPTSKRVKSTYTKSIQNMDSNGTYVCEMNDPVTSKSHNGTTVIKVFSTPKIILSTPFPISTTEVYLNWTVFAYNSNITAYQLMFHTDNSTDGFRYATERPVINIKNTSYLWQGLNKSSFYQVKIKVITDHGEATSKTENFTTLSKDPIFIPNISINGFSATSVTIAWDPPEKEIEKYIHHYILEAYKKKDPTESKREACHHRDDKNLPYMFDDLDPHCTYVFKVKACSDFGGERCGNWSAEMEAATLDGKPSKPDIYHVNCTSSYMLIYWHEPKVPKAEIKGYTMELTGTADYIDVHGKPNKITWGPLSKFKTHDSRTARFDDLQPYTRYEVRLSAMTRSRRRGEEDIATCTTETAPPDQPPRPRWRKILEKDKYLFKMHLPRVSERNGPICCYRVYMVHLLPNSDWKNLPDPKDISVMDYRGAHAERSKPVAYITDIFSQDYFPSSELVMGDGVSHFNRSENKFQQDSCSKCLEKPSRDEFVTATPAHTTPSTAGPVSVAATMPAPIGDDELEGVGTEDPEDDFTTPSLPLPIRSKRSFHTSNYLSQPELKEVKPEDGPLEPTSNYTMFVEIIIPGNSAMFSHYVNVLMPAPTPTAPQPPSSLEIALQATCGVAALVLLLMIVVCIRQTRKSRKMPPLAHVELDPIRRAYRKYFGERPQMIPAPPPDMPPIAREDLAAAYAEKQVDSDYGFQKEFEYINMHQFNAERVQKSAKLLQMLPECYPDRTTHASEARENQPKNRYPDIKAYDQTRVKLSQIDSIMGSDYINANYVNGYQERKRFICAQGPTDTTVNDFWRMIWEHGLELIVMLTNLEEYSKVKCSKYWPDELRGSRAFGSITVQHVAEKRFSDYIVRELRITKQPTTADGQPIVDNNGVAKRNGDCKEAAEGSVPTSPREVKDLESRIVKQYHFLMWKDFAAPEHAYSILKFIKRVNEAWSAMVNRPCVVHCSAGVGRTGTLVALDHLLDQLENEGHAAVFNTVAELRRQRNFLVQSLKQYVFVYRALVEYAHYGDTEIPACRMKGCIDRLRNTPPNATTCLMELEFEKILNNPIAEPLKSCAAGAAEELKGKNRSQEILPYDRNRVILAPIPTREYSTYINASFIEAYDNSEGYIITQDPLPNTIMDFWRMVSEHNVTTIVMLSELGEGKCPRYWDDGTAQYEHISVQYEESESCPYYTRRQFRVANVKTGGSVSVRQLQYQGWPTAAGAVPEVTRGLAELADVCQPSLRDGSMLVHCYLGTERSSLFVALCILICQLRTERRVDVCSVARKIRSQRARTIDTFLHYEFLHRAILNYAELHNIGDES